MKTVTTALRTLITSGDFVRVDLYTFTLIGGAVYRYCSGDRAVSWGGNTFTRGLKISDGGVKLAVGLQSDPVELTIFADSSDQMAGTDFLKAVRANALAGASIKIERAYAPTWAAMSSAGPTGTLIRFSGQFSAITSLTRTSAVISAAPWLELLNVNMPTNVIQATCLHTLFDVGCTLSRSSFAVSGTVGSSPLANAINSSLTQADGYFSLGKIVFTSGSNNGLQRTVKVSSHTGALQFVQPLPSAPATGDTFTIYPGCDGQEGTCSSKFSNLAHYRGFPFVPVPETAL